MTYPGGAAARRGRAFLSAAPVRHTNSPPVVATLPTAWTYLGLLFGAIGALVMTTSFLVDPGQGHPIVVRLSDAAALATSAGILFGRRRLPRQLLHPVLFMGGVMITVAVLSSGGGSTAVAYATAYLISPLCCRLVLPQRQADSQLLVILVMGVPTVLLQPGVGAGATIIFWGIALLAEGALSWLVATLHRAETDSLTGLLNGKGLERVLSDRLRQTSTDTALSIALLEFDRFSAVVDDVGRSGANLLLRSSAAAWMSALTVHADAELAMISPVTFAVLLPGMEISAAAALTEQLRRASESPMGCSAGVVAWEPGQSSLAVLARAEGAVAVAKRQGRGRTSIDYGNGAQGKDLQTAIRVGQFAPWFQPIVDLSTSRVLGAEALARWEHPERGVLAPGAFLDTVEQNGLIGELGERVLRAACEAAATWPCTPGQPSPYVSVNASSQELQDPLYAATVKDALASSGLEPSRLVIELVESQYDAESVHLLSNLQALRDLGVRTALDDFGIGYSSLDRLRRLTSDIIKIDKSFIDDVTMPDQEAPLVLAVLALGQALNLRVIAEGIEEQVQADWLRARNCHYGQGWLFGKAQPGPDFAALLRHQAATLPSRAP